jgi:hypothetical protein
MSADPSWQRLPIFVIHPTKWFADVVGYGEGMCCCAAMTTRTAA